MVKQLGLLLLASGMFVIVWVLVIVQFNETPEIDSSLNYVSNIELKDEFEQDMKETHSSKHDVEHEMEKVEKQEEISNQITSNVINLQEYDFSHVSTPEGVPIDAILNELNLN
ncbi:hypothetical protein N0O92_06805 [Alkalihalobacillus sp. MEB130]|uniref:hypothetical protein n=1 Tax=Alkalihalobacillus sp. MEB130 TaxID=2976704 RepID=UPI0028DFACE9|nr:hypothetical protein [Alkalihalobacillus sp. MEB130]MDT8859937.1 hypothetical protein [Alkalihalobacillus sp. MEB130]